MSVQPDGVGMTSESRRTSIYRSEDIVITPLASVVDEELSHETKANAPSPLMTAPNGPKRHTPVDVVTPEEPQCCPLFKDTDEESPANETSDQCDGTSNGESIAECPLFWAEESEDDMAASPAPTVNREQSHENEVNESIQLPTSTSPSAQSTQAATINDEPNDQLNEPNLEPEVVQQSPGALNNPTANECSTSNQSPLHDDVVNEGVFQSDTESYTEFPGWNPLPDPFLIDLTLDDDDFGQNTAAQAEPIKPKPIRRRTFAGIRNNRQKSNSGRQNESNKAQPTKPRRSRRQTFGGIENKKQHKCNLCGYSTPRKDHFNNHIRTHIKEKAFACDICAKRFVSRWNLNNHMRMHQSSAVLFPCSNCNVDLLSEKARKSHEVRCKNGLRQYECFQCKKMVHNRIHLLEHMRQHTGKRIRCLKCYKPFSTDRGLIHHMKTHADLFKFHCNVCYQVFSRRDKWQSHQNRCKAKQYVCDICDRFFVNKSHFDYHVKTHAA